MRKRVGPSILCPVLFLFFLHLTGIFCATSVQKKFAVQKRDATIAEGRHELSFVWKINKEKQKNAKIQKN